MWTRPFAIFPRLETPGESYETARVMTFVAHNPFMDLHDFDHHQMGLFGAGHGKPTVSFTRYYILHCGVCVA